MHFDIHFRCRLWVLRTGEIAKGEMRENNGQECPEKTQEQIYREFFVSLNTNISFNTKIYANYTHVCISRCTLSHMVLPLPSHFTCCAYVCIHVVRTDVCRCSCVRMGGEVIVRWHSSGAVYLVLICWFWDSLSLPLHSLTRLDCLSLNSQTSAYLVSYC